MMMRPQWEWDWGRVFILDSRSAGKSLNEWKRFASSLKHCISSLYIDRT